MSSEKKNPILRRLKTAIQKVKFLLSFEATRWIVSSIKGSPAADAAGGPRRLSFKIPPSLRDCSDDYYDARSFLALSRTTSSSSRAQSPDSEIMSRSISDASSGAGDDDVDQRADRFIQNFYRQLMMERQISLELRYVREKSLERTDSD